MIRKIKKILINIINSYYNVQIPLVNSIRCKKSKIKLRKFHNKHIGERCFIVGNGPSLMVEDLNKLKNEICFGTHQIYNIFDRTDWRPTYYCAQDCKLIQESIVNINKMKLQHKFMALVKNRRYKKINNAYYLELIAKEFYPKLPQFSEDITNGIYEGYTVSYMCLQLAIYMGFKEIYLLGIDHNYKVTLLPNGEIKEDNEVQNHFSDNYDLPVLPQLYKSSLAYVAAQKYAKEHNIKILNATRGGKLDAFERIDFNSLF